LLKLCAVCGPESEQAQSGQIGTKFINIAKLTDQDYHYEGLRICVSWFEKVLEGTANSNSSGNTQLATGKLTTRGSKSVFDLRRKVIETYEEILKTVQDNTEASARKARREEAAKMIPVTSGLPLSTGV